MAELTWDKVDERPYQHGISHGVLYIPQGVVWLGLTSMESSSGVGDTEPLYFDGIKYNDYQTRGESAHVLSAFTYPDEFEVFSGFVEHLPGVFVDSQKAKPFGLSYQTQTESGYRIHILFNLTVVPSARAHETDGENADFNDLSWSIEGTPTAVPGYNATEYFIIDSEDMDSDLFAVFQEILYGSETLDAYLPPAPEFVAIALLWDPRIITPNVNGIADLISGQGDLTPSITPGFYQRIPHTRLAQSAIPGLYILEV